MHFRIALTLILGYVSMTYAICDLPLQFGKNCTANKPSVRFHLDKKTQMCMAFKFNGCGGNKNNFKTIQDCRMACIPMGSMTCPGNTKQGNWCNGPADCESTEKCQYGSHGMGICCRKAAINKMNADYDGKCAKTREVAKISEFEYLIGKNCKHNFCPKGAPCRNGNFFATCCALKKT